MKLMLLAPCVVFTSLILGCTPEPKRAEYTVEQYLADRQLMNKKIDECANNPGDLSGDADCVNAVAAGKRTSHKTMRDLYRDRAPADSTDRGVSSPAQ